ncbi:hypothetical protein Ancab_033525 [Ancistrocladus abbreviatus]
MLHESRANSLSFGRLKSILALVMTDIRLNDSQSSARFVSSRSESIFNTPFKLFEERRRCVRFWSLKIELGIEPSSSFPASPILIRWLRSPSQDGICPVNWLKSRCNLSRYVKVAREEGRSPYRLVPERYKCLSLECRLLILVANWLQRKGFHGRSQMAKLEEQDHEYDDGMEGSWLLGAQLRGWVVRGASCSMELWRLISGLRLAWSMGV